MGRKSILLVDDDAVVRDMIRSALEKEYNIFEASKCSEAINQSRNRIDLALIDYVLPDCDGFHLLKEIRKAKPALPAIIMTAYGHENVAIKAVRAGVTDYIKKPLSILYLLKRISEILGEKNNKQEIEFKYVKSREDFIMDGIAIYIERHYMEDLTLEKMSDLAHMNRTKFCRAFRERFGQTFKSYLKSLRLRNAIELLKNPDLNITEIASFVGYEAVAYFERIFKEEYGISPREYRKKLKE